jgi:anthranilate 1,2-dioxygenase (deaminating, decarboxylating) large subunit
MRHNNASKLIGSGVMAIMAVMLLITPTAKGYDLPTVNLGFTSFLDGGPPAGPGFYYAQYLQYYTADTLRGSGGQKVFPNPVFPDPKVDVWASLSQIIAQCPKKLVLGAQPGLNVIIPVVDLGISGTPLSANKVGLGDVLIGPYLQWDPIMGKNGPIFMHRVELQCITPTGRYNPNHQLNPGANIFSFNPYWAGTLFITPKLTLSTRIHYLWNDENGRPDVLWQAAGATRVQPGQAVHLNFATEYEVIEKRLRVGINGYYLKQISDTSMNGRSVAGTREEVLGIGPGLVFHINQNNHLFFNAYFETMVDNRTEGMKFLLRFVHHF